jgi:NADPH-dependent 7-cyano-7-deazaguanine reductase QueF-like protein
LWFAETYGLVSQSLKLSNNSFESIEIDFSDTVKQYNYQDLANEEKKKMKDLIRYLFWTDLKSVTMHTMSYLLSSGIYKI